MPTTISSSNYFVRESDFEQALVDLLPQHGWEPEVLMHPTEDDLLKNWAKIIYDNNRGIAQLGNAPLTSSEMQQIMDKVNSLANPCEVNRFINGGLVSIKRDNKADTNNYGKEVYLKIFDAREISSGQSRYQIVRQPHFRLSDSMLGERRGDVLLLINGMPVIHIELKRSKVDVSQAVGQLKRYAHEGVFQQGMFKLVQIFVAMTPDKSLYFANPGKEENFTPTYQFHWGDFNNDEVTDWKRVTVDLLSIPMAHQMVGYYTIADDKDQVLKVLRSYQYFAANRISDRVHEVNRGGWDNHSHRGGYIWHTTGSGKTMTSFKSAQLIAKSGDADKVVFLMDRIELSTQSLDEYRGFAGEGDEISDTPDTAVLLALLLNNEDNFIVTSLQKMALIRPGITPAITDSEITKINKKRIVFIVDECHRSTFGDMLMNIKKTFTRALFFGFTGTPVFEVNAHNEIQTSTLFGDNLHKYTIADGIRDGNVLGFDPYQVRTYDEMELREAAAKHYLEVKTIEEIEADPEKKKIYDRFINEMQMPSSYNDPATGKLVRGIEAFLPNDIYKQPIHHTAVADDVVESRKRLSKNGKFHAMMAVKNIPEVIDYYHLFKKNYPSLRVAAVFDNNIDNDDKGIVREDAIVEMLNDYNARYHTAFNLASYGKYKKDVAKRLAHKKPYQHVPPEQQIDLLIVVTQMLTGYDSKWVNTLYVDKTMKYVDIIQAFSRTNRLFGQDKPFGTIRYYTMPYTMQQNIEDALELYMDRPMELFVDKLEINLTNINRLFTRIKDLFEINKIENFASLPDSREHRNMFAKDFLHMNRLLEAAKLQGFDWEKSHYEFEHEGQPYTYVDMLIDEQTFITLLQRYKELFEPGPGGDDPFDFEYPEETYLTETGTGTIDAEYIDSNFQRYVRNLYTSGPGSEATQEALKSLHKMFASLSQKDQRTALIILHDIQSGELRMEPGKTIYDYIAQYQAKEVNRMLLVLSEASGLELNKLRNLAENDLSEQNINEYGRFDDLMATLDREKARTMLEKILGHAVIPPMVMAESDKLIRRFLLHDAVRESIINAYLCDNVTIESIDHIEPAPVPVVEEVPDVEPVSPQPTSLEVVKQRFTDMIDPILRTVQTRSANEIVERIYWVLQQNTIADLDGVGTMLTETFNTIFGENPTLPQLHVAFHSLVMSTEPYLKKLYYVLYKQEIKPQYEGEKVTWKDVVFNVRCLWKLRSNMAASIQAMSENLERVKAWRNNAAHLSVTATKDEVLGAIETTLDVIAYATAKNIKNMEKVEQGESLIPFNFESRHRGGVIYEFRRDVTAQAAEDNE